MVKLELEVKFLLILEEVFTGLHRVNVTKSASFLHTDLLWWTQQGGS